MTALIIAIKCDCLVIIIVQSTLNGHFCLDDFTYYSLVEVSRGTTNQIALQFAPSICISILYTDDYVIKHRLLQYVLLLYTL